MRPNAIHSGLGQALIHDLRSCRSDDSSSATIHCSTNVTLARRPKPHELLFRYYRLIFLLSRLKPVFVLRFATTVVQSHPNHRSFMKERTSRWKTTSSEHSPTANFGLRRGILSPMETLAQSVSTMTPTTTPATTIPLGCALAGNGTWLARVGYHRNLSRRAVHRTIRPSLGFSGVALCLRFHDLPRWPSAALAWSLLLAYVATGSSVIGGFFHQRIGCCEMPRDTDQHSELRYPDRRREPEHQLNSFPYVGQAGATKPCNQDIQPCTSARP